MKAIDLNKEQKDKLLEMCAKLFPECADVKFGKKYFPNTDYLWMYDKDGLPIEIHWFEFCMTHLINALAFEFIESDILADCEYEQNRMKFLMELYKGRPSPGRYHPVDYLYQEFKKLK